MAKKYDWRNEPGVHEALKKQYPIFKRLTENPHLSNFKITSVKDGECTTGDLSSFRCTANASRKAYPHTRSRLIEQKTLKKSEIHSIVGKRRKQGKDALGYEELRLCLDGARIQIWIKIYGSGSQCNLFE